MDKSIECGFLGHPVFSYSQLDGKGAPVREQWQCSAVGKVTLGLASHWSRVRLCSVTYGLNDPRQEGDAPHLPSLKEYVKCLNVLNASLD